MICFWIHLSKVFIMKFLIFLALINEDFSYGFQLYNFSIFILQIFKFIKWNHEIVLNENWKREIISVLWVFPELSLNSAWKWFSSKCKYGMKAI